jgi:thymidylate kinase
MPVIINVRGTSGSGKTTAVRTFLNANHRKLYHTVTSEKGKSKEKLMGYRINIPYLEYPTFLIGPYENVCGGLDGVGTQENAAGLITGAYLANGNVLCEGLLLSSVSSGATVPKAMIATAGVHRVIFAFMDTPIETCIERVKQRRLERGDERPLDETNTRKKFEDCQAAAQRLRDEGCRVEMLNHLNPSADIYRLLKENE